MVAKACFCMLLICSACVFLSSCISSISSHRILLGPIRADSKANQIQCSSSYWSEIYTYSKVRIRIHGAVAECICKCFSRSEHSEAGLLVCVILQ